MADTKEFGESFQKFMETMNAAAPRQAAFFPTKLGQHFGTPADALPIVTHRFPKYEEPNLQLAIDELLESEKKAGREGEAVGVTIEQKRYEPPTLASLVSTTGGHYRVPAPGPVEYRTFELPDDESLACIYCGLLLVRFENHPVAVMINGPAEHSYGKNISVDVMASTREIAERFLTILRSRVHALSVYRGHALSVQQDEFRGIAMAFHELPRIGRDDIILPAEVLERVERQTISFARHAKALAAAKRHLRRGVLLYGPPGTGKTLTAMYLATQMPERTVVLATGRGHGMLEYSCWLARSLQPATVILEDVDLIAKDRRHDDGCANPLLFELLNQMDGLADDADVLFILTTNRPEALEPALAARPGRIDAAIEVPLPDEACRRRLIALYADGIDLRLDDEDRLVARTQGASAAFIKELLRRATLLSCVEGKGSVVTDRHTDEALRELVISGGLMSRRMLGFDSGGEVDANDNN
jgi:hypothetical protein